MVSNRPPQSSNWFNSATNRLVGVAYDAAGNRTQVDPFTVAYDAENRQSAVTQTIQGTPYTTTYGYDGEGRRVKKVLADGTTTVFVYDAFGKLAAEYASNVSGPAMVPEYVTVDHLGSTRLVTNSAGGLKRRYDYAPFGEALYAGSGARTTGLGYESSASPDAFNPKFAGKERDAETGLDYFGARYFSGAMGRFTSPDAPLIDQYAADPQSWNLYAYVRNSPLNNRDPNGHWCLFETMGTTCHDKDIPPPPIPLPPPAPPAVITPGTPQNGIANAQDSARANPAFAPQGTPGSADRRTFCNFATCSIVSAVGGPMDALTTKAGTPNLANTDATSLANSPQWREVTPQEAQNLANNGVIVVAAQANPGGHGHVATVRPELMPGLAQQLGQAPLMNNIGSRREIAPAANTFSRSQPVRYYAPANQR